jgi:hypothetical protein
MPPAITKMIAGVLTWAPRREIMALQWCPGLAGFQPKFIDRKAVSIDCPIDCRSKWNSNRDTWITLDLYFPSRPKAQP